MHVHMQEKGIDEAFWPLYELDERPEEGKGSHWFVRIAMALALVGTVWALHVYVPDKAGTSLQPEQILRGLRVKGSCPAPTASEEKSGAYSIWQLARGISETIRRQLWLDTDVSSQHSAAALRFEMGQQWRILASHSTHGCR